MLKPNIKDVKIGMVFDTGSTTMYGEKNFARVVERPFFEKKGDRPDIFYALFVNPKNFAKKRIPSDTHFAVWDYEYKKSDWKRVK